MNAHEVMHSLKKELGEKIRDMRFQEISQGAVKRHNILRLWLTVDKDALKEAVACLARIHENPHFSVISGYDLGKSIELTYHFMLNYASRLAEFSVSMKVMLGKKDLKVDTISGIIPGALVSEREISEMLGVEFVGTPDGRRLFLHGDFPKGVYPWRRDGTGPERLVRNLNEGGGRHG
jgi:membrane-bound hydrogenase subunit beta